MYLMILIWFHKSWCRWAGTSVTNWLPLTCLVMFLPLLMKYVPRHGHEKNILVLSSVNLIKLIKINLMTTLEIDLFKARVGGSTKQVNSQIVFWKAVSY